MEIQLETSDITSSDLESFAHRRTILESINPEESHLHHSVIRQIFQIEKSLREKGEEDDYWESLYWAGYLLYRIGDLEDSTRIWEAKKIDYDTMCGFDVQTVVGAGYDATVANFEKLEMDSAVEYLKGCNESGTFDDLDGWGQSKNDYFYGVSNANVNDRGWFAGVQGGINSGLPFRRAWKAFSACLQGRLHKRD